MSKRVRNLLLVTVLLVAVLTLSGCAPPQGQIDLSHPNGIWQAFVYFLAEALIFLHDAIARAGIAYSWGWAIIVFTIIVKLVTLPLTLKQLQSTRATQELQPRLQELQQKYGKDRQKLSEEQMKLYKESGVNPMGGCLPLIIQMPILFGLYQSLYVLANPSVGKLQGAQFFWIPNLAFPDLKTGMGWIGQSFNSRNYGELVAYFSLPVLMILSQLVLQKMTQPAAAKGTDNKSGRPDQTQMMNQMMMFMPIFFGYITLGLPSGLTLYWSVSNILSLIQQYFVTGWGGLGDWIGRLKPAPKYEFEQSEEEESEAEAARAVAPRIKRRRRRK